MSDVPMHASSDASAPATRYLALGDSFTIGTGSRPEQSFPARLAERWRAAGCAVTLRNLGVNGYTTQDLLDRELPEVAPSAPTVVTLAVGANDIVRGSALDRYRAQLRRLFDALSRAGVAPSRIVALPQPDWSLSPAAAAFGDPADIARRIADFNAALRDEALARGARYVDLSPLMRRQARAAMLAPDGLHPSAEAHDQWADALATTLRTPCAPR